MAFDPRARATTVEHAGISADFDEGLRKYMLGTYNYMALGVAFTGTTFFAVRKRTHREVIQRPDGTPMYDDIWGAP